MTTEPPTRRYRAWPAIVVASAIGAWAISMIWWLAIPRYEICAAIYPAPPGCAGAARELAAISWTILIVALYAALIAVSLTAGRSKRWPVGFGLALLAIAAIAGYFGTLFVTGFFPA